jgi:hypothetical protein
MMPASVAVIAVRRKSVVCRPHSRAVGRAARRRPRAYVAGASTNGGIAWTDSDIIEKEVISDEKPFANLAYQLMMTVSQLIRSQYVQLATNLYCLNAALKTTGRDIIQIVKRLLGVTPCRLSYNIAPSLQKTSLIFAGSDVYRRFPVVVLVGFLPRSFSTSIMSMR